MKAKLYLRSMFICKMKIQVLFPLGCLIIVLALITAFYVNEVNTEIRNQKSNIKSLNTEILLLKSRVYVLENEIEKKADQPVIITPQKNPCPGCECSPGQIVACPEMMTASGSTRLCQCVESGGGIPPISCGDHVCSNSETAENCPADCGRL
jgi:hypothetical protein